VSCLLILVAVGTARGVMTHLRVDPGFAVDGLVGLRGDQSWSVADSARFNATFREMKDVIAGIGGVRGVARASRIPFGEGFSTYRVWIESRVVSARIDVNPVEREYFAIRGATLLAGRFFDEQDDASAQRGESPAPADTPATDTSAR
jgi:hypothetical protein